MKTIHLGLAATLAAPILAAPAAAQDLTFWSWRQEDREVYEPLIEQFEAEHDGITVTFEPYEATSYNTILATALSGGPGLTKSFHPASGVGFGLGGNSNGCLDGAPGAYRDAVLLNAAAALVVASRADDLKQGVDQARESLDSGAARKCIEMLAKITSEAA